MRKRLFAMLLVVAMVLSMIPVMASAETTTATPEITKVNMTLKGILDVNFRVDAKGIDMTGYGVRVTIGSETVDITNCTVDGSLRVYTAKLPAHRMNETLHVELVKDGTPVQPGKDWTVASYLTALKEDAAASDELKALTSALSSYGTYAAAYNKGEVTDDIGGITAAELAGYKPSISVKNTDLSAVAALYLDDAADLLVKFNSSAWNDSYKLLVDGVDVTDELTTENDKKIYRAEELLPQNWSHMYNIQVVNGDTPVYQVSYGVNSYVYQALSRSTELKIGLNNLLKAMYSYSEAAEAYSNAPLPDSVISYDPVNGTYDLKGMNETQQATEGLYYSLVSETAASKFSIEADFTCDEGDFKSGLGFVLKQGENVMLFNVASKWDVGVSTLIGDTLNLNAVYGTPNITDGLPMNPSNSAFNVKGTTTRLKLVYDNSYVYLMYLDGATWKAITYEPYYIGFAGGAPALNNGTFNTQAPFSVGVGTLISEGAYKGPKTAGGTISDVEYTTENVSSSDFVTTLDNIYLRDTYMLKADDGKYYLYGTAYYPSVPVWSSTDKVNWASEGIAYCDPSDGSYNDTAGELCVWAPEVTYDADLQKYVMIVTMTESGSTGAKKSNVVLTAESPKGPFTISHKLNTGVDYSLDGTLYEENGQKYLIFANQDTGYMQYVTLDDTLKVTGTATDWFSNKWLEYNSDAEIMDGPQVYTDDNNQKWILWSTFPNGDYQNQYDTYTQYATKFSSIKDTFTACGILTKGTLYKNTVTLFTGGGHGMILEDGQQDYLVIHAPNANPRPKLLPVTMAGTNISVWDGYRSDIAQQRNSSYVLNATEQTTVFFGDSFMDPAFWTNFKADLTGKDALLLGIGGTTAEDWYNYFLTGLFRAEVQPKNIVFNLGNNDIHNGDVDADGYMSRMQTLLNYVHELMPNTKLYVYSIANRKGCDTNTEAAAANLKLKSWCDSTDGMVTYVDVTSFDPANSSETLNSDGIHPAASYYTDTYLPNLTEAGCELAAPVAKPITSLSELSGKSGDFYLTGNITDNTTTVTGFTGTLDGGDNTVTTSVPLFNGLAGAAADNVKITNLNIVLAGDMTNTGVLSSGVITRASIENVHISAENNAKLTATADMAAGAFAPSCSYSTITDCSNAVSVTGASNTGGLFGTIQEVTLTGCSNSGAIDGGANPAGGLVGRSDWAKSTFVNCTNTGTVTSTNSAGGMLGMAAQAGCVTDLTNCVNEAAITSNSGNAGGMVGLASYGAATTAANCDNKGAISGQEAGGIIGYQYGSTLTLKECDNFAAVTASLTGGDAGGIFGRVQSGVNATIESCENGANAIITGYRSGGVGAYVHGSTVTLTSCANAGEIHGPENSEFNADNGGILGRVETGSTATLTSCVNDGDVTGAMVAGMVAMTWESTTNAISCTNNGNITAYSAGDAAGILGRVQKNSGTHPSTIQDCINTGKIVGSGYVKQLNSADIGPNITWTGSNQENGSTLKRITALSQIDDLAGNYILVDNITDNSTTVTDFTGTLDGNNFTVTTSVNLFANTTGITVKNLNIKPSANFICALVPTVTDGTFENVHVLKNGDYKFTNNSDVGGLVAQAQGTTTFTNCSNAVDVVLPQNDKAAGGIAGRIRGGNVTFNDCTNTGTITGNAARIHLGGIIGTVDAGTVNVLGCTNSGTIKCAVAANSFSGGIIGSVSGGTVTVGDYGDKHTTNSGNVELTGNAANHLAGGVVGYIGGTVSITNVHNSGNITASRWAGGIAGLVNTTTTITRCTNTGSLSNGESPYGSDYATGYLYASGKATVIEAAYTLTYVLDGGTNPESAPTQYTTSEGAALPTPTKTGYNFAGWFVGDAHITSLVGKTGAVELTAHWEVAQIAVSLPIGGGYTAEGAETVAYGSDYTFTVTLATAAELTVKNGDTVLTGTNSGLVYTYTIANVTAAPAITIEVANAYTITYDVAGGNALTGEYSTSFTEAGAASVVLPTAEQATRENYKLLGWYIGDTKVENLAGYTSDVTLTAKWGVTNLAVLNNQSGSFILGDNITNTAFVSGFTGTLDGNNFTVTTSVNLFANTTGITVKNLYIKPSANFICALVPTVTDGTFENVHVLKNGDYKFTNYSDLGGLVAQAQGTTTFTNCSNAVDLVMTRQNAAAGGIAGNVKGGNVTFTGCSNTGNITGGNVTYSYLGGIVGIANSSANVNIYGCVNSGEIVQSNNQATYIGGIMGYFNSTGTLNIASASNGTKTQNSGAVKFGNNASANKFAGGMVGIIGSGTATIENAENTGAIVGKSAGGMVGYIITGKTTLTKCVNKGTVSSSMSDGAHAGGMIGYVEGKNGGTIYVYGCTNEGNITASGANLNATGGIVGMVAGSGAVTVDKAADGTMTSNSGSLSSSNNGIAGGIVGFHNSTVALAISNAENSATKVAAIRYAGGIVGTASSAAITNCTNSGAVACHDNSPNYTDEAAGGIIGYIASGNTITITGCSSSATVAGGKITGYEKGDIVGKGTAAIS